MPRKFKEQFKDFLFVVPALAYAIIFAYYPLVKLFDLSFTNWNLLRDSYKYVGTKNYEWLFYGTGAKYIRNSIQVTVIYAVAETAITIIGGMLLALLLKKTSKYFKVLKAFAFLPRYISISTAGVVFLWMLNTNSGILNRIIMQYGGEKIDWLGKPGTALLSIIMLAGWKNVGYGMMIYLSAMPNIPREYYEAAAIDGATNTKSFFKITLPLLAPTTYFLFITSLLASLKAFQSIDIMTQGGPIRSTEVYVYLIYHMSMEQFRVDRASAAAVVFFVALLLLTIVLQTISKKVIKNSVL